MMRVGFFSFARMKSEVFLFLTWSSRAAMPISWVVTVDTNWRLAHMARKPRSAGELGGARPTAAAQASTVGYWLSPGEAGEEDNADLGVMDEMVR